MISMTIPCFYNLYVSTFSPMKIYFSVFFENADVPRGEQPLLPRDSLRPEHEQGVEEPPPRLHRQLRPRLQQVQDPAQGLPQPLQPRFPGRRHRKKLSRPLPAGTSGLPDPGFPNRPLRVQRRRRLHCWRHRRNGQRRALHLVEGQKAGDQACKITHQENCRVP